MQQATDRYVPRGFQVWHAGRLDCKAAQDLQLELVDQRRHSPYDLLLLLEHPPVITLGRTADRKHLLWSDKDLEAAGIDCFTSHRGGDITLHNPGQLVGYPIVDLSFCRKDLHRFLRQLESVLIHTLADFGLHGETFPDSTGVWVKGRKIASIGIAVRHWISYHGFALNINNDLSAFEAIVPCGLQNVTMTSMSQELGKPISSDLVGKKLIDHFSHIMQRQLLGEYHGTQNFPQA